MTRVLAIVIACFGGLVLAAAAEPRRDVSTLAADVSRNVIAPGFAALDVTFSAQAAAWTASCEHPASLRDAYNAAADAWAQVEFFRTGPLSKQTRAERIDYWPDPRNATEKGLKALLAVDGALTPQTIADASVAAQGLPALERLLFANGEAANTLDEKECAVGRAIAQNLSSLSHVLDSEWHDTGAGELQRLDAVSKDDAKAREAAVALLTDLATGIRVIEDRKLPPLLGAKGAAANPKAVKSWRTGRSVRDIAQNLAALDKAYTQIAVFAPQAAASVKEKLHEAAMALEAAADPNRAITIQAAINNARYYAADVLPGEIGVTLGFNSLDGD
jgi:predicted lipoprotein